MHLKNIDMLGFESVIFVFIYYFVFSALCFPLSIFCVLPEKFSYSILIYLAFVWYLLPAQIFL